MWCLRQLLLLLPWERKKILSLYVAIIPSSSYEEATAAEKLAEREKFIRRQIA
jgi:hypothetical protein